MNKICLLLIFFCTLNACKQTSNTSLPTLQIIAGKTMGTTYNIRFVHHEQDNIKLGIDSLLKKFDFSASTYNPNSTISLFNKSTDASFPIEDTLLIPIIELSKKIYKQTDGAFDPTVQPLVNYWHFGNEKINRDEASLDSLVQLVGFDKIDLQETDKGYLLSKENPNSQLDLSAIAKGYGVDLVGKFMEQKNIHNYLVEIGGEMRARGQKPNGSFWSIAIDKPLDSLKTRQYAAILSLKDNSLATSGNYRNFYEKDGQKFVHTIHPKTGLSTPSNLLSASVVARDCATADGIATALMVMGVEQAKAFATAHTTLGVLLIYADSTNTQLINWDNGRVDLGTENQ